MLPCVLQRVLQCMLPARKYDIECLSDVWFAVHTALRVAACVAVRDSVCVAVCAVCAVTQSEHPPFDVSMCDLTRSFSPKDT